MQVSGEYRVPAPRQRVWEALNDPRVLCSAIPGCDSIVPAGEGVFSARVRVRLGPVNETFEGPLRLTHADKPQELTAEGVLAGCGKTLSSEAAT